MRSRYLWTLGALSLAFPIAMFAVPRLFHVSVLADDIGDDSGWRPTPGQIAAAVGRSGPGAVRDRRHEQFAEMFKMRYRSHSKAVGLRFEPNDRIKLMFSAVTPRWDMAHVAIEAASESRDLFGVGYTVDIFETFISSAPVKLGELRFEGRTHRATVRFDPSYASTSPATIRIHPFSPLLMPGLSLQPMYWYAASVKRRGQMAVSRIPTEALRLRWNGRAAQ